jgi:murein DD-endopeptidase MepM/ murein hydrolase activator NlpD
VQLQSITSNFTPTRYFDGSMGLPVAAPLSASFGATRSYNGGVLDSIHTGTDFAAATGTPILAPAAGKVVFAGHMDIRGNVTIIDHGWGVFTVYCHQSQQNVQVGDTIAVGQMIGLTGSTGRVTGPHLHWELWIDGVVVDAMQWVSESFS